MGEEEDKIMESIKQQTLIKADGSKVEASKALANKSIVCLYFSAHWCPPCRGFTPVLTSAYSGYAAKDIEIVFVSSDQDQGAFDGYYREMPWAALPFSKRDLKGEIAKKFGVSGIPMLVMLKPDGTIACANGRGDVQSSSDMATALAAWGL